MLIHVTLYDLLNNSNTEALEKPKYLTFFLQLRIDVWLITQPPVIASFQNLFIPGILSNIWWKIGIFTASD